jgi:hypothetical protein
MAGGGDPSSDADDDMPEKLMDLDWICCFRTPMAAYRFFSCLSATTGSGRNLDLRIRFTASGDIRNSAARDTLL